jgi:hypothetical protein
MKFTSANSPDENRLTIIYETEGNGYIVGERAGIERLADFLRTANVAITNIRPANGLYCFDFTALHTNLNQALTDWPDAENYALDYVHPRQPM